MTDGWDAGGAARGARPRLTQAGSGRARPSAIRSKTSSFSTCWTAAHDVADLALGQAARDGDLGLARPGILAEQGEETPDVAVPERGRCFGPLPERVRDADQVIGAGHIVLGPLSARFPCVDAMLLIASFVTVRS